MTDNHRFFILLALVMTLLSLTSWNIYQDRDLRTIKASQDQQAARVLALEKAILEKPPVVGGKKVSKK